MGIINRFLLFVLMIGLALLAVLMLLLCMGAVPEPVWLNELHYILSRRETVVASVVVLVLALHLLGVSLRGRAERTRESGDFILLQNEQGGVRMAKVRVQRVRATSKAPETLRLVLDLTVGSHTPVGPLTETAAAAIRAQLQETMGLEGVAVESHITGITDALPEGKRRVV